MDEQRVTRRGSLLKLGGAGVAAALGWKAVDQARGAGPAAVASGAVSCVLTPEQTEGPYFLPGDKVRRDVREGKRGTLLTLKLTVLDVSTCKPIKGAAVDIWHCDAVGNYAATSNRTFLRGIQRTDAKGVATFKTLYPGWYPGRTVHIHVKVSLGGNVVHTGQLYFPDSVTDKVYTRAPYSSRPGRSTRNPDDSIYRNGGSRSTLKLKKVGNAYTGSITMGVQR
jgi:protocatechuate 3,4-dioxygenase beta subunit